jgi:hypothetical protein
MRKHMSRCMTVWYSNQKTSSPVELMSLWNNGGDAQNVMGTTLKIKVNCTVLSIFAINQFI